MTTSSDTRLPVVLLTGFLGAGKTTLLNFMLRHPQMSGTAVVINEYGAVGLDHHLVASSEPDEVELIDGGCVCCTVRGKLTEALMSLFTRSQRKELPTIKRLIIETTGLAEPGPILGELLRSTQLAERFVLDSVVTLVDAANADSTLSGHEIAQRQITSADRVLITKADLVEPARVEELKQRLREMNPDAQIEVLAQGAARPDQLFSGASRAAHPGEYQPGAWLGSADTIRFTPASDVRLLDGDRTSSGPAAIDDVQTFSLIVDEPLAPGRFFGWLDFMRAMCGPELLRLKGLIHLQGQAGPIVVHGVQNIFHPPQKLESWPDGDQRTRMVFITRGLGKESIGRILAYLEAPKP